MKGEQTLDSDAFLATLLGSAPAVTVPTVAPPAVDSSVTREATPARPKPRRIPNSTLYDQLGQSLAQVTAVAVAGILWWVGAQFTLAFLVQAGVDLARLGPAQWLIPAGVTAIELWLWPHAELNRNLKALFLLVAAIDLGTSMIGLVSAASGWTIPATTLRLPQGGLLLWLGALFIAALCAFWPEKLGRAGVVELRRIWKI